MNLTRKVSSTTYPIVFMMVDSTDHITGETGLTPTVTISKNGGSYGAAAGAVSEIANGIYALAGNATDRNTLGELWVHADGGAGVDKSDFKVDIVSHDPYGDLAAILEDTGTTIPDVLTAIKGAGWADETLVALMTAIEAGTVDEATIRTAIGLSTANLDTQLSTIDTEVGTIYSEMASVDDVWDEALSGHSTAGSAGKVLSDAALEASLTAIKGAGWTDETLVALKTAIEAIATGSGATVNEIWNELTATHTTVGSFAKAITDILQDTGTDIPALITALSAWQATNVTTAVSSGSITDIRGSSWSIAMTDLTLDSNKQQFSIKRRATDQDADAILFVDSATGLLTLNGVSSGLTAADAALVYAGTTLTLTLKANVTAQLPVGVWHYGVQYVTAAGLVEEPYGGTFTVTADIVRATT